MVAVRQSMIFPWQMKSLMDPRFICILCFHEKSDRNVHRLHRGIRHDVDISQ